MTDWKSDYRHIDVTNLMLDLQNPRTDSGEVSTEEDVITELLDENVLALAEDIVENGYAPVSVFMAIESSKGKYTVIDGNRRLSALKVLHNPKAIHGFASYGDFKKAEVLASRCKEELSTAACIVYPTREKAEKDMAKLHLAGISIQQWKLIRQYRFFQKRIQEDDLSIETLADTLALDKSIIKKGVKTYQLYHIAKTKLANIVEDIGEDTYTDKNFRTDKFQRAIVNAEGERFLGYAFNEENHKIEIKDNVSFLDKLRLVLFELYDNESPYFRSAQFSANDRLNFFKSVEPNFIPDKEFKKAEKVRKEAEKQGQTDLFKEKIDDQRAAQELDGYKANIINRGNDFNKIQATKTVSTRDPKGLFWSSKVPYRLGNSSLKEIYKELKNLEVESFPNASHDLLRTFLECALAEYLTQKQVYKNIQKNNQHTPKLTEMLSYAINNRIIQDDHVLDNLKHIKANWSEPYSLQRMNSVNHNKNYSSTASDVRSTWGMLEDLFVIILKVEN